MARRSRCGAGNDTLRGDGEADVFVFERGFGNDTIADFDANAACGQDHLDIVALGITAANFALHVFTMDVSGGSTVYIDSVQQTIFLQHDIAASITQDDFTLAHG
jgi:Ca2+-binding RTX toxin-like protein